MKRYIVAHKEFDESKFEKDYTILTNKLDLKFEHDVEYFEGLDDRLWSEIAAYKGLMDSLVKKETYENQAPIDWLQFNHYRRKFDRDIYNRLAVPEMVVLPVPVWKHYEDCHNGDDLRLMCDIVKEKTPVMIPALERTLNGNLLIPYTIATLPYNLFKDYVNFLYTILSEVLKKMKVETYEDMIKHVTDNDKYKGKLDDRPEYQARVVSFLAERLGTAYFNRLTEIGQPVFVAKVEKLEENQKM